MLLHLPLPRRLLLSSLTLILLAALTFSILTPQIAHADATIVVNTIQDQNNTDPAHCSLHEAITAANTNADFGGCIGSGGYGSDTITFDSSVFTAGSHTITLTSDLPYITADLTIQGLGASLVTVDGGGTNVLFATNAGAAITFNISGVTLTRGKGVAPGGVLTGGALFSGGSGTADTVNVNGVVFTNNIVAGVGGAIEVNAGTTNVSNSTFSGNSAGQNGGAIDVTSGSTPTLKVINSTFSGNQATFGGGAIMIAGTPTSSITNSTIFGNSAAPSSGGGIYSYSNLTVTNSIITNNTNGDCGHGGGTLTVQYSLIGDGSCGVTNGFNGNLAGSSGSPLNPHLGTLTGSPSYFPLLNSSPAINAGSNALIPGGVTIDERGAGFPRIFAGLVDMGAYEAQQADCPTFPYTVPASASALLEFAIDCANGNGVNTDDEINLTNSTYTLTQVNNVSVGNNGLPAIVDKAAGGTLTINGNGATITRDSAAPAFRIFAVNAGGDLTLSQMTISNGNIALSPGGGILTLGALTISNSTFIGNSASSGLGGAIDVGSGGSMTVSDSTFTGNSSTAGGGAIANGGSTIISGSTFSGNSVSTSVGTGGAIYNQNGMTITNSTFSGNSVPGGLGGGIFNISQPLTVSNSTFSSNSAGTGGGIYVRSSTLNLNNSIVANSTSGGDCFNFTGSTITVNYSLIRDATCGVSNNDANHNKTGDPLLGSLADNDGLTQTMALGTGSPAIGAGSDALAVDATSTPLTTDQRGTGFPRKVGTVDMGAFEVQTICPTFPHTIAASDVADLILSINCANTNGAGTDDVINLTNSTYTLTAASDAANGGTGLPVIVSSATAGTLTINGNGATITRSSAGGTPNFRILRAVIGANLTVDQVTISNGNLASASSGGGILNQGTLTITNSIVSGNSGLNGGGISSGAAGTLTVSNSTFSGNTTFNITGEGGAIFSSTTATISNSTFSGNTAASNGGGIHNQGPMTVINSTFSGNTSPASGGGIFATGSTLTVTNSTFSGNSAPSGGSGIYQSSGTVNLNNSIIANSLSSTDCFKNTGTLAVDHSLIMDGSCGASSLTNGNKIGDPLLGALGNNGGATQTMALGTGSPALDTGSNALAVDATSAPLDFDQRGTGFARIIDTTVDMGAFEAPLACPTFPHTVAASDMADLILSITCANSNGAGTNDVINLTNSTYTLTTVNNTGNGANGLPIIVDVATAGTLTINGNGATITRNGGAPAFRIFENHGTLTLDSLTISNGSANSGGGIYNQNGALTITNSTISGNSVSGVTSVGGGIQNQTGTLNIISSSIVGNNVTVSIAGEGGGIFNSIFGTVSISASTISGNTISGTGSGGGIFNAKTMTISNSTIADNSVNGSNSFGGGIYDNSTAGTILAIRSSTISGNSVSGAGSQIGGMIVAGATLKLDDSIIANSTGSDCLSVNTPNIQYSLIEDASCGVTNNDANHNKTGDPKFDPAGLADNGGLTQTIALVTGSPAIDTGSNALAVDVDGSTPLNTDQRGTGFPRIVNTTVDMGAFESAAIPTALLSATKTVSGVFEFGQTVTYTVTINNTGTGTQADNSGHEFTDTLPATLTLVSANPTSGTTGTVGNTVNWDGTLAATNGSVTIVITATINPGTVGDKVSNQGTVSYDSDADNTNDATALTDDPGTAAANDATAFVVVAPNISVTKTLVTTAPYHPGDTLNYQIVITNNGTAAATAVTLNDTPDANSALVVGSVTTTQGTVTSGNTAGNTSVTVNVGTLAVSGGTVTITYQVTVNNPVPAGTTTLSNTATVTGTNFGSTASAPVNAPLTTTASLVLTKSDGGATVAPGGTVTYTLSYSNNGNIDQTNVVLTDTVPANTTFDAANSTSGWACTPDNTTGSVCTLTIGVLASTGSGSATFTVIVNASVPTGTTQISNAAGITSDDANNTASDTTPLNTTASLTLTKDDGGISATLGDTIPYTLGYSNDGDIDQTSVVLTDTVPANTTFNAASSTAGWVCTPDANAGSVCTLTIGALATSVSDSATFAVTVNASVPVGITQISNSAGIASDDTTNTASDTTPLTGIAPGLTTSKTASDVNGGSLLPDDIITYTITVTNSGNINLTNVVLIDLIPVGTTYVTNTTTLNGAPVADNGTAMPYTTGSSLGNLAIGASATVVFNVKVDHSLPGSGLSIDNTANLTTDGGITSSASAHLGVAGGPTPIPAQFFQCENLAAQSDGAFTSTGGDGAVHSGDQTGNVYCHIIAKNSSFVTSSQEIGIESVLNLGVQQAVDVFGQVPGGYSVVPFDRSVQVCLRGTGEVLFLNAANARRTIERLSATQQGGYLCVTLTGSGTVVLVNGTSVIAPIAAPTQAPTDVSVSFALDNCRVTTTQAPLNLRAEPSASAQILDQLPYGITLTATERVLGWYRVVYLDGQGWVSATYLSFAGDCGQ